MQGILDERDPLRLPSNFSFGKTKIHDFHSGLFSREVTSLFEKRTILYYAAALQECADVFPGLSKYS